MKAKKVAVICLTLAMTIGMLGGCGSSEKSEGETTGEQITLNYWTWFPSKDQIQETVDAFEKENPDIKINMTVMESKAFQEKVPLALSTEEDIDVIGVPAICVCRRSTGLSGGSGRTDAGSSR